jgi:hypothetical protein
MLEKTTKLVIEVGDLYARGILFEKHKDVTRLLSMKRILVSLSPDDLVSSIKLAYRNQYDQVQVVGDREEWFKKSVQLFSDIGTAIGLYIGSDSTLVEHATFGRTINNRKLSYGIGKGIDQLMLNGGLDYLKAWLQIEGFEKDDNSAINALGNYSQFPAVNISSSRSQSSLNGLLRFVMTQINWMNYFYNTRFEDKSNQERGVNRILLAGEVFKQFKQPGDIVLAVVDSLQLEGIWEIYLDVHGVVPAFSLISNTIKGSIKQIGVKKLGTILVLTHNLNWGDRLGKIMLDLGLTEDQQLIMKSGELVRIPYGNNITGAVGLDLRSEVDIKGYRNMVNLAGGSLGLIVDARGRPLPLIEEITMYKSLYPHWKEALEL